MYKILFLDDEKSVVDYLPLALQWETLGITELHTATRAQEGLALVKKHKPDIVIVDVEMPEMNGLVFCREAQKICSDIKFVILSAFDRFDYAREAILIGVDDYLLKPVDETELEILMKKIIGELEERKRNSRQTLLRDKAIQEKRIMDLFWSIMNQKETGENVLLSELFENICIIMQGNEAEDDIEEIVNIYFNPEQMYYSSRKGFHVLIWERNLAISMEQKIEYMKQDLMRRGFIVQISYVRRRERETLHQALLRCFYALERQFYPEEDQERIKEGFGQVELSMKNLNETLRRMPENGNSRELCDAILQVSKEAFACYGEPVKICAMILDILNSLKIYLTANWQADIVNIFRNLDVYTLMRCGSQEKLCLMVQQCLEKLDQILLQQEQDLGSAYIVKCAKEYTKIHYQDSKLSLQEVADVAGISRTYFSKVFKDITGKKYWDYLTEYRIRKAREFLINTNLKQLEISQMVGYESEFHFSRKFKELTGMSPNKFRRNNQSKR
ncbi:MAG: response regulator [Lachnospiraceae bacterium]|nr:response regulator [Lachnospiraceae bacterium]